MNTQKISAFVVCCNEEKNIRRCLESIKWCDEIVIIDSGSKDRTLEICREYTSKILHKDWAGYVEQKAFGLSQCSSEWALNIDADEEVSPELQVAIKSALQSNEANDKKIDGFQISRVVFYMGRWWRRGGWYPEYRLRLCRKSKTSWGGNDPHEKAIVDGTTKKISGELRHYTYSDISDQVNRLNRYSTTIAHNMFKGGERSNLLKIIFNPLSRFIKFYFLKKGFLEGFPGLVVAYIEAYYAFLKYAKLWELQREKPKL